MKVNSLIKILDVLKTGDQLTTDSGAVRNFELTGLSVAVSAIPAGTQGGDFHGIIELDGYHTAVFIGDIAGHDFSSSILATRVIRYIEDNREKLLHPHLFLRTMNGDLFKELSAVGRFFTSAICVVDTAVGRIMYASAGHPPGLLLRADSGNMVEVGIKAMPLGFEREVSFQSVTTEFLPGDRLLMYTDGVSGARSAGKEELGQHRLEDLLRSSRGSAAETVLKVVEYAGRFGQGGPDTDDRTVVCINATG
ncbi:MAG TPA: PP2C family protein-serine/threonine phosphatase [bacterium]|nr:PP2C family protein-serine/threonine phosphatase [bacterium]